jgi:signal transduction histidine kinase
MVEKTTKYTVQLLKVKGQDSSNRRSSQDRRKRTDRRSGGDRRLGWGKIEDSLLEGAMTTAATLVFQFSRPFTIILGYIDLLADNAQDEDTRAKLKIIKDQLELIGRILNNFRELDRYQTKEIDGLNILDIEVDEPDRD